MTTRVRAMERYLEKLRPDSFDDVVGQRRLIATLEQLVEASTEVGQPLSPLMLVGERGIGKSEIASVIAAERARRCGAAVHRVDPTELIGSGAMAEVFGRFAPNDAVVVCGCDQLTDSMRRQLAAAAGDCKPLADGQPAEQGGRRRVPFSLVATADMQLAPRMPGWNAVPMRSYRTEELMGLVHWCAERLQVEVTDEAAFQLARQSWGKAPDVRRMIVSVLLDNVDILSRQTTGWRIDNAHVDRVVC